MNGPKYQTGHVCRDYDLIVRDGCPVERKSRSHKPIIVDDPDAKFVCNVVWNAGRGQYIDTPSVEDTLE